MTQASIFADTSSLKGRPNGPATGSIWLVIDGRDFPTRSWNDFVVVVMSWWAVALLRLLNNASTQEIVNFMDGPYAVEVSKVPSGILRFRALEGAGRTNEVAIGEGPTMPFILEFISQSRAVLDACRQQSWWSKDAETLKSSVEALEQESSRLLS